MQSGITASTELHAAFTDFLNDPTLFALPITITISAETLTPLPALPFHKHNNSSSSFASSLPSLEPHIQPKTPQYIVLRRRPPRSGEESDGAEAADHLTAITYIPSDAPVRAKTLFASTRTTLVRELGREWFEGRNRNLFLTERREVLDPREWEQRDAEGGADEGPLTREEVQLRSVRRAEDEERFGGGTKGRRVMGNDGDGDGDAHGARTLGVKAKMDVSARTALAEMGTALQSEGGGGTVIRLSIDLSTETLILSSTSTDVAPAELASKIAADSPSYTFYHYPCSTSVIFIYCCPAAPSIRERMLYASLRANVVQAARDEGVEVARRVEIGSPDEMGEERLRGEVAPSSGSGGAAGENAGSGAAKQGFARPKRPGKR